MLEVCERFGMRIAEYMTLPPGERALYNRHTLFKLEAEAKTPVIKIAAPRKGG